MNIASDLDRAAASRPSHPVMIFDEGRQRWSFEELDLRASRIATGLEQAGVTPGDRVGIAMSSWPEHVASWYGITKAGAVPVDLNILLSDDEWSFILKDCRPSAMLVGADYAKRIAGISAELNPPVPVWVARGGADDGESLDTLGAGTGARPAVERADDDLCVIAYTSGTTGFPKGVMHSHGLLNYQLDTVRDVNGYEADDTIINLTPLFPLHGFLLQPAMAAHVGCTLLMLERFSPQGLASLSRTHVITTGTFVPAIVIALLQMPEEERAQFKKGTSYFVGGAPLHPDVRTRFESAFGVTLLQGFGSTEVMGAIAMERKERRAPWGSCGELWPGAEKKVRVVDEDLRDVPAGEVGEFAVHRSLATKGYWENPDQTRDAFIDGEWFRMGDIGRIDENGFVFLLDRKKDMIIRGGFNIYSAELERALGEHPAVAEPTVLGIPHATLGEVPKAYVVLRPGNEPTDALAEELKELTVRRLGKLKVPEEIEFVALEDLPRNAMGKVLKRELRERVKRLAP